MNNRTQHYPLPSTAPPYPAGSAAAAASTTICTHCDAQDRWILHVVKLNGYFRKLCTACVLKLHLTHFCASCLAPLSDHASSTTMTCFKCGSHTHAACIPHNAPKAPFLCGLCGVGNGRVFDVRRGGGGAVDERAARGLVCAARIAAASMSQAAAVARRAAEGKAREAVLARKRAREAMEEVTKLTVALCKRRSGGGGGRAVVNGSGGVSNGNGSYGGAGGGDVMEEC